MNQPETSDAPKGFDLPAAGTPTRAYFAADGSRLAVFVAGADGKERQFRFDQLRPSTATPGEFTTAGPAKEV